MPDPPRRFPHLYLARNGKPERYSRKSGGDTPEPPLRNRSAHATALLSALASAMNQADLLHARREPGIAVGDAGTYLDFRLVPDGMEFVSGLEDRRKGIEVTALRQGADGDPVMAAVYLPDSARDYFQRKIDAYRTRNSPRSGRPQNEPLVARIERIELAGIKSLFTDELTRFPDAEESIWWEVWIRDGRASELESVTRALDLPIQPQSLSFPDREVRLVRCNPVTMARVFLNSGSIAELRRANDSPRLIVGWPNIEQAEWAKDLAERVVEPPDRDVAVCLLDTGVTRAHPLLEPVIHPGDAHRYDPSWIDGDIDGHGTMMAGTIAYGDLMPLMASSAPVHLTHCIESVKILPDRGTTNRSCTEPSRRTPLHRLRSRRRTAAVPPAWLSPVTSVRIWADHRPGPPPSISSALAKRTSSD